MSDELLVKLVQAYREQSERYRELNEKLDALVACMNFKKEEELKVVNCGRPEDLKFKDYDHYMEFCRLLSDNARHVAFCRDWLGKDLDKQ